jgi:hypothetical protein
MLHTLVFLKKEVVQATSPVTAMLYMGMKAAKHKFGSDSLQENEY